MKRFRSMRLGFAVLFITAAILAGCPDTGGGGAPALTGTAAISGEAVVGKTITAEVSDSNGRGAASYQ